jgi:GTP-binding protein EngB required for normal cell division
MSLKWEWYASRRGANLHDFLEDVQTLKEAQEKFSSRSLIPPEDEKIIEILETRDREVKDLKAKAEKVSNSKKALQTRARGQGKTSKKSPTKKIDREEKDEKYFRKVLPTKKAKK